MKKLLLILIGALALSAVAAINYPTSLDNFTNPTASDRMTNVSHSAQHANANDAIEALQAKVGINNSAVSTSLDYQFTSRLYASGTFGVSPVVPSGAKAGFLSYPRKGAARAGAATVDQWDNSNIGDYSNAFGYNCVASGSYSLSVGDGNTVSGSGGIGLGRSNLVASTGGFGGGFSNTISSGTYNFAFGNNNGVSGPSAFALGSFNTASGSYASAGGVENVAAESYTFAGGWGAKANKVGQRAESGGYIAAIGDAQGSRMFLRATTEDDTPTEIFLDGIGGSSRMTLANNTTWTFSILITARRTDSTGGNASYKIEGTVHRDATAGTTTVDVATKTEIFESDAGWDVDATADVTHGALIITVTGEAAKTINWHAVVQTSEISG